MAGTSYTRQSTLTDGDTITASLFNDEYNQLINAFAYATTGVTGHQHDGGAGEGGNIEIIGDQDFKNKITVDSANNRWSVFVEVGGTAVEQVRIEDGVVYPVTDSDVDLGTDALRFKAAYIDSLTATGNLIVGGTLVVTGNVDFNGDLDVDGTTNLDVVDIDGAVDMATTLTVAGNVDFNGDLDVDGTIEFDAISGTGAVTVTNILDEDNMSSDSATALVTQQSVKAYVDAQVTAQDLDLTDGTTTIAIDLDSEALSVLGGTGVTSTASGNGVTLAIDSTVTTLTGSQTLTNKTLTSPDVNTPDIDGGTIDGTVIGGATAAAGSFTTVGATGNITVGGTVDGRDVAADGTKLDGIEASATADQTDAEIRTAVEAATDSNVYTDADHTKLNAIEASADVTDVTNVTAAGALMDSEVTNLAEVKAFDSSDYATAAQGATADAALPKAGGAMTGAITTNSTFDGRDVATDGTKLDGIEASADVTDATNVTAAGALMDSELTAIASVKALNQGVATGDSPTFTNLTLSGTSSVKVPAGTTAQRDGTPANGMFRYNSTNEQFEGYQNSEWGAIGGGGGSNTFTTDAFTGNGSTAAYALSQVINSENNLMVFIAGVFQQQSAYSIATASGTTTLTFSTAPANTREIVIYSIASAVSGSNLNIDSMTGDGSDVTLSLTIAPVNENNTQVFIDGVYQSKANYSISGTTLTFSTAPPTGSAVEVMTMTQTEVNVPVDGTITSAKLSGALVTPSNLTVTGTATMDGLTVDSSTGITINGPTNQDGKLNLVAYAGTQNAEARIIAARGNTSGTDSRLQFLTNNGTSLLTRLDINDNGDISFYEDTGTTAKLFWDSSAESLGIGTSSPAAKLHTASGVARTSTAKTETAFFSSTDGDDFRFGLAVSHKGGATDANRYASLDSTAYRISTDTFAAGGSLVLQELGGNVGIGTTAPTANITIDKGLGGSSHTTFTTANSYLQLGVSDYNSSGGVYAIGFGYSGGATHSPAYIGLQQTETGSYTKGDLVFRTRSTSTDVEPPERMRITAAGALQLSDVNSPNDINTAIYSNSDVLEFEAFGTNGAIAFTTGSGVIERARISSSGNLLVGRTTPITFGSNTTEGITLKPNRIDMAADSLCRITQLNNSSGTFDRYYIGSGIVGSITGSGTSTSYNTSSDQRLKENIADANDAGSKIDAIQVRQYDWKADGSHQDYGMIAQELVEVAPEAVSGDADSEDMMGVDYSKLVPMMLKEIQSLRNRVATLEE